MADHARDAHLNLVESSRRLFELDSGVEVEDGDGWMLAAGRANHPVISNAAFRIDDDIAPDRLLERARSFFGSRGRGFAVWARAGEAADRDLIAACESDGLQNVFEMPEMVLGAPVEERPAPDGFELGRVGSAEDAADYWQVASSSYASLGFPPRSSPSTTTPKGCSPIASPPSSLAATVVPSGSRSRS